MRIDFYLLNEQTETEDAACLFACRLVEKAYLRKHRIYLQCQDRQSAEQMDDLLWCFKQECFIPHNLQGEGPEPPPPVQIGYGQKPAGFNDILINLAQEVPPFYRSFNRVIEIVPMEESSKTVTRAHYRFYRQQGHQPHTHRL